MSEQRKPITFNQDKSGNVSEARGIQVAPQFAARDLLIVALASGVSIFAIAIAATKAAR